MAKKKISEIITEESLKKATAAAGEAVTRKGAAVSIPCWKELEEK